MKTLFKHLIPVAACAAVAASCSADGNAALGFDNPVEVKADSIAVNEIIQPNSWTVANGYAVLTSRNTDNVFYVYSLPDFSFKYKYGTKGQGPGEFPEYISLVNDESGDTGGFIISNYGNKTHDFYSVDGNTIKLAEQVNIYPLPKRFQSDIIMPSGMILTEMAGTDNDDFLYTRSGEDGRVLDSVRTYAFTEVKYDDNGNMYQQSRVNRPLVAVRGSRAALIYELVDHADFYEISPEGKFGLIKSSGKDVLAEDIEKAKNVRSGGRAQGIVRVFATDRYIYALWVDIEMDRERRKITFNDVQVRIYGWDGERVKSLSLEKPASNIIVSGDDSKLYTYNMEEDFEKVYVYDTGL